MKEKMNGGETGKEMIKDRGTQRWKRIENIIIICCISDVNDREPSVCECSSLRDSCSAI